MQLNGSKFSTFSLKVSFDIKFQGIPLNAATSHALLHQKLYYLFFFFFLFINVQEL